VNKQLSNKNWETVWTEKEKAALQQVADSRLAGQSIKSVWRDAHHYTRKFLKKRHTDQAVENRLYILTSKNGHKSAVKAEREDAKVNCPECGKAFNETGLALHRRRMHGVPGQRRLPGYRRNGVPTQPQPHMAPPPQLHFCPKCGSDLRPFNAAATLAS
jgi:hypothetical protein